MKIAMHMRYATDEQAGGRKESSLRTAIYIRVSTEEQAKEGYSIEAQKYKLTEYCRFKEWPIEDVYIDEGISGKSLKERPEAMRMIEDCKNKKINNVLIYKLDRLTRSVRDLLDIVDLVNKYDIKLNSLSDNIDTSTPNGQMLLTITGAIAENERKTITERMLLGKEQKVRMGGYNIGPKPYGYEWDKEKKEVRIIEHEAEIVRYIFDLALQGKGYAHIYKQLNNKHIPTATGRGCWHRATVMRMLKSPLYTGRTSYSKNKQILFTVKSDKIPAIIDDDAFEKVQRILNSRSMHVTRKWPKELFIFGDVLYCGRCGYKMKVVTTNGYSKDKTRKWISRSYKCKRNSSALIPESRCSQKMISQNILESVFLDYIYNLPITITDINIDDSNTINQNKNKISKLNSEINKINTRKHNALLKYIDNKITDDEYQELLKFYTTEINIIEEQITQINNEIKKIENRNISFEQMTEIMKMASHIENLWDKMTNGEKRIFITTNIKKIYMSGNDIKSIEFY